MTIKEMIEVLQAYKEGNEIQCKFKAGAMWHDEVEPLWNFSVLDYRIKPESKYRPYKDTDEMFADCATRFNKISAANSMPLIWVMHNKTKSLITDFSKCTVRVFGTFESMSSLYDDYTYLDGSPCGKEVAE